MKFSLKLSKYLTFEAISNKGTPKTNERSQRKESVNKRPSWIKTRAQEICMVTRLCVAGTNGAVNRSVVSLFSIPDDSMDRSKV